MHGGAKGSAAGIWKGGAMMPKYCTIEVTFMDGHVVTYHGGLHVDEKVLRIWPVSGGSVTIPLVNIRKYVTQ